MAIEEFSPDPPPPQSNPGALWAGLVLVAIAVLGGIGIFWFMQARDEALPPARNGDSGTDLPPPVRTPSVVEVTDGALKASSDAGLTLAVTDVATREENEICVWAGRLVLRNDGAAALDVERPDAGNTYLELEEAGGRQIRSRQESRTVERLSLAPGASTSAEWRDEFGKGITRFRVVHVETVGEVTRVVATPWIDVPKGGR